jgi:hypothetical protein
MSRPNSVELAALLQRSFWGHLFTERLTDPVIRKHRASRPPRQTRYGFHAAMPIFCGLIILTEPPWFENVHVTAENVSGAREEFESLSEALPDDV